MSNYLGKLIGKSNQPDGSTATGKTASQTSQTPLQRLLDKPGRVSGSQTDHYYGMENFGNTCYCNSILQSLYYTAPFREHVLRYPAIIPQDPPAADTAPPLASTNVPKSPAQKPKSGFLANAASDFKRKPTPATPQTGHSGPRNEEHPDSSEARKRAALLAGPVLSLESDRSDRYSMQSNMFSALRDIYEVVGSHTSRTGIISPKKFIEVLRRDNEMYKSPMHQDAHEFLSLLLNSSMEYLDELEKQKGADKAAALEKSTTTNGADELLSNATGSVEATEAAKMGAPSPKWVQDILSGTLVSETKCLTCETASQRDEPFLDLSIDLEQHSSITSGLHNYSAPEMLCERNKFHCDKCGDLQEAEKRLKIKRLPKILAIHLKRFKWQEEAGRMQKLFHRVVYPSHLRLWNTTLEADEPDRLYELYAVVVHVGSGPYHGHYVSVIKTPNRGWLLFDDELVEPVSDDYVHNFYGDLPGQACAYVLFYQEIPEITAVPSVPTSTTPAEEAISLKVPNGDTSTALSPTVSDDLELPVTAPEPAEEPKAAAVPKKRHSKIEVKTSLLKMGKKIKEPMDPEVAQNARTDLLDKFPIAPILSPTADYGPNPFDRSENLADPPSPQDRKPDSRGGSFRSNPFSKLSSTKSRFKLGSHKHKDPPPLELPLAPPELQPEVHMNGSAVQPAPSAPSESTPASPAVGREGGKRHIFGALRKKASVL